MTEFDCQHRVANAGDDRPLPEPQEIFLRGGFLPEILDQIDAGLAEQQISLFKRFGMLVRPRRATVQVRNGEEITDTTLAPVNAIGLMEPIGRAVQMFRFNKLAKSEPDKWVPTDCPEKIAGAYLARNEWSVRPLVGIINAPTLRPDGSLLNQPGYDRATGLLYMPTVEMPSIPAEPDLGAVEEAIDVLDELIGGFPFESPEARAVALAAILTSVVRRSLPTAPAIGITATKAASGKGLLADTIATVGFGRRPATITWLASDADNEKQIGSLLLRGDGAVSVDNCVAERPLGGSLLNSLLTQRTTSVRVLGLSKTVDCDTNALFLFNGNNLIISHDLCRRILLCSIDPNCEHPERRKFDFNPVERASADRGRYVAAALTILLGYRAAGSPPQQPPLGSYEVWSRWIRDALLWAGEADPCATIDENWANDPEIERIAAVLDGWENEIGLGRDVGVKEIISKADEAAINRRPDFRDALSAVAAPVRGGLEHVNARRLGKWLAAHKGAITQGRRIYRGNFYEGNRQWRLERVEP